MKKVGVELKSEDKFIALLVLVILIILIWNSDLSIGDGKDQEDLFQIPIENKIELDKIWEINMDAQQANYTIEDDILYIVSANHTIHTVDINTGKIIRSFKVNVSEKDGYSCSGVAVYNGILAINYDYKLIVLDTKNEKILLDHDVANSFSVAISYDILMYKDLLIFSNIIKDKIYAMNYNTGEVVWEYGDEIEKRGNFNLYKYKGKYLFTNSAERAYYEFEPLTGNIINKYSYGSAGEIANEDQSFYIPKFNNIEDKEFEIWLIAQSFDVFILTRNSYIYTYYGSKFYYHGINKDLDWMINLQKEIWTTKEYGRYIFLNHIDSVSLLDLEKKEILWNIDFEVAQPPRFFTYKNRLYLPGKDGNFKVFDLSKLEK